MSRCLQPLFSAPVLWPGAATDPLTKPGLSARRPEPPASCPRRGPGRALPDTRQSGFRLTLGGRWWGPGPRIGGRGGLGRMGELATRPARGGAPARRPPLGPVRGAGGQESPPWRWVDTRQSSRSTRPCAQIGMEASRDRPAMASTLSSAGLPHCPRQAGSWHHLVTAWMGDPPLKPLAAPQGSPPTPWSWQPRQPLAPGAGALDTVWGPGAHTSLQDN